MKNNTAFAAAGLISLFAWDARSPSLPKFRSAQAPPPPRAV